MNPYRDEDAPVSQAPVQAQDEGFFRGIGFALGLCGLLMIATDARSSAPFGPVGTVGMLCAGLALKSLVAFLPSRKSSPTCHHGHAREISDRRGSQT